MDVLSVLELLKTVPSESLEGATLEFKEYASESALHNAKDLAEELVAFANADGGALVVGVRDSSNVKDHDWPSQLVGFPKIDLIEASARIRGKIRPELRVGFAEVNFEGKSYLVISVDRRNDTLVMTSNAKVYVRDGRSSRPMTPNEVAAAVKSLGTYDWSADTVPGVAADLLEDGDVDDALADFARRREITESLAVDSFLEAIGATKNGVLTKAGLLFFGKREAILKNAGLIEFRFSWKTAQGELFVNDVWSSNLWTVISKCRGYFERCNRVNEFEFDGKSYRAPYLDPVAFHEALMNAIVHRDYSKEGAASIDFDSANIRISSPGGFYGGVTQENIYRTQPRHRNKALAKLMMDFSLVDRAGMGVPRMSYRSLVYGRSFPRFTDSGGDVEVVMQGQFFRAGIFVLTAADPDRFTIVDLVILNSVYGVGFISVERLIQQLSKIFEDPWAEISTSVAKMPYVEFCATRQEVLIRVTSPYRALLDSTKSVKVSQVSGKLVALFTYLMKHGSASNSDITELLKYKYGTQTSEFLKKTKFVKREGNGAKAIWSLVGARRKLE